MLKRLLAKGLVEVVPQMEEYVGPVKYRLTDEGWRQARGITGVGAGGHELLGSPAPILRYSVIQGTDA